MYSEMRFSVAKKTIKVSEATNTQLDWLVAKCENGNPELYGGTVHIAGPRSHFEPTTDWSQMGPIIEREKIDLLGSATKNAWVASAARSKLVGWRLLAEGPTSLIAAARCYVASKLGETVEVPEELV
ncbi:MAG TPA: hypothetical protein DCL60_01610 [Armatimonadetes bacterium]|nr:hypothetical protein [Armatimonadota bacterium]